MTGLSILDPILHFLKSVGNTSLFLATRYGVLAGGRVVAGVRDLLPALEVSEGGAEVVPGLGDPAGDALFGLLRGGLRGGGGARGDRCAAGVDADVHAHGQVTGGVVLGQHCLRDPDP